MLTSVPSLSSIDKKRITEKQKKLYKLGLIHKTQADPSSSHENNKGKWIRLHDWLRSTGSLWFKREAWLIVFIGLHVSLGRTQHNETLAVPDEEPAKALARRAVSFFLSWPPGEGNCTFNSL